MGGIHTIEEGHIGIYTRGGALLKGITEPGFHSMVPILTSYHQIQIILQTDEVLNIPVIYLILNQYNLNFYLFFMN